MAACALYQSAYPHVNEVQLSPVFASVIHVDLRNGKKALPNEVNWQSKVFVEDIMVAEFIKTVTALCRARRFVALFANNLPLVAGMKQTHFTLPQKSGSILILPSHVRLIAQASPSFQASWLKFYVNFWVCCKNCKLESCDCPAVKFFNL
jgi:hypothetical protein